MLYYNSTECLTIIYLAQYCFSTFLFNINIAICPNSKICEKILLPNTFNENLMWEPISSIEKI